MSDPVTYSAMLPVAEETVLFVSRLLAADRAAVAPDPASGRWAVIDRRC
jgi:hypothetical protein